MHELNMRDRHHRQQLFKDLKLSKFSDIWTIDKTHNKFLARQLTAF
jgi:hypothetical protein